MYDIAVKLCGLAAVGLFSVGLLAVLSPRRLSRSYGVETNDRAAFVFVRAAGVRDIALGVILGFVARENNFLELLAICSAGLILSLADFILAITFARGLRSEHGAHIGGAIAFLVILALLLRP